MHDKDLQYVLMIANYGNITKAADALYLSQPALSIHLNRLEQSLGVQLFERTGRKMILTYAGEEFVKAAREITMKTFELEDRMKDIRRKVSARLRVGYMVKQIEELFPEVMLEFSRNFPQSSVYVVDGHLSELEEKLLNGEIDLFFGYQTIQHSRCSYEQIYEDDLVAVLPKDHPACSYGEQRGNCTYPWLDLRHVAGECFILQHSNQSIRQFEEDALLYAEVLPERTYKISSINAGVRMAARGFGVAFTLTNYLKGMSLPQGASVFHVGDPSLRIPFSAVLRKGEEERTEIREWIRLTREQCAME